MQKYHIIGLMSGTSLDGLDMAYVQFWHDKTRWKYQILKCKTLEYSNFWQNALQNAHLLTAEQLVKLDMDYGHFLGKASKEFIGEIAGPVDLVSSHGHTIFHNPTEGYTLQIGNGNALVSHLNCPLACDFRTLDIAYGGQGAPLVPIGDRLLFSEFDACINLGGFANISILSDSPLAWDICPANFVLNRIANQKNKPFDKDGEIAENGKIIPNLLRQLEHLTFYSKKPPKSLGREWVEKEILPLLLAYNNPEDLMTTFAEHIVMQLNNNIKNIDGQILITGGGAKNRYLIQRLRSLSGKKIIVPDNTIIDFKEALIFALMGLLRLRNEINIDGNYTGSQQKMSSGALLFPAF